MAATDVLSMTEAKEALSIGALDVSRVNDLERLISTASTRLEEAIGPIVQRVVTHRVDGGYARVELPLGPVSAVSSVTEWQGTSAVSVSEETLGSSPSDGWVGERYDPDPSLLSGILVRRSGGSNTCWYPGTANVEVTYTAGRVASTTDVDPRHKEAAVLLLRNLWRAYESSVGEVDEYGTPTQSFPAFALPNAVKDLLRREMQDSVGFG